jgi:hypothetical protein
MELIEAATVRPGRRFESIQELAVHEGAVAAAAKLPGSAAGLIVIPEMPGPIGIPDFIAIVGGRRQLAARLECGINPIRSPLDASIVSALHVGRARSVPDVGGALSMPLDALSVRLRALTREGAVQEVGGNRFVRNVSLTPGGTVYAIEAKVRDWRRAALQSRKYRVWTDNYVLALGPVSDQVRNSALEEIAQDGAGLIVAGLWIRKPTAQTITKVNRFLAFEHIAAALSGYQPSSAANLSKPIKSGAIH